MPREVEARHVVIGWSRPRGAVGRIGQGAPTCVHRFVVASTIEDNVAVLFAPRVAAAAAAEEEEGEEAGARSPTKVEGAAAPPRLRASEVISLLRQ